MIPAHLLLMGINACEADADHDGYTPSQGDCDDTDPGTYPGAPEQCDARDNSCDGVVDDGMSCWAIVTVAGSSNTPGYAGDGGPVLDAKLNHPSLSARDLDGNLYIADTGNHVVRKVAPDGTISTVAGTNKGGYNGDGIPATEAQLFNPYGVAVDVDGTVLIADTYNHRIRRIEADGTITTVAGTGTDGSSGDGGAATGAQLSYPGAVSTDNAGGFYIADTRNCRVRRVDAAGVIHAFAGSGFCSYGGDGGAATKAWLWNPLGVSTDYNGDVLIADGYNHRIRKVFTASGQIYTVAGTGAASYGGDGGPAIEAQLNYPGGVVADAAGDLFITDTQNQRVRMVDTGGIISTFAGNGVDGYLGDNGPATAARLNAPYGLAIDTDGNLLIADTYNNRIRKVLP